MTVPHPPHGVEDLCEAGLELYTRALREDQVPASEAELLPCTLEAGLLQPDFEDVRRMRPVPPVLALARLQRTADDDIARRRRQSTQLAETFEPLLALALPDSGGTKTSGIHLLSGVNRINSAISATMATVSGELLTIQPSPDRHPRTVGVALERDQALLDRGGRIRTLYQHTQRHIPETLSRYEQLRGDVEARTLDEVTDRLILVDRAVAFIPAGTDRSLALEVRHPALITYFATTFDRLWRLATPMHPRSPHRTPLTGITPRQRAIAALLVEGHTDAVIADRLGMNIRTARVHIAKLATTLGSDSRAQLGYLIAESGILKQKEAEE
ncbi:helix-turn-helix domain-containing protein [Streptomyces acidiscabies]|uniref:helix-turn-helix domain-containing protein n=1 Tax=Streptomyces acidiscabies TaxID=42234 RepID=UPI00073E9B36|nr:helix-turn-helix transcriptional regulator [Streptomyces acidiscabies]GAQ56519.1 bacterial regulatory proteins, luxR family [Streptomyces acidiscabies]GAV46105.1 bacterial regulatory proteins, luxR family [Streptomyces acidiscabies]